MAAHVDGAAAWWQRRPSATSGAFWLFHARTLDLPHSHIVDPFNSNISERGWCTSTVVIGPAERQKEGEVSTGRVTAYNKWDRGCSRVPGLNGCLDRHCCCRRLLGLQVVRWLLARIFAASTKITRQFVIDRCARNRMLLCKCFAKGCAFLARSAPPKPAVHKHHHCVRGFFGSWGGRRREVDIIASTRGAWRRARRPSVVPERAWQGNTRIILHFQVHEEAWQHA